MEYFNAIDDNHKPFIITSLFVIIILSFFEAKKE